ncbi:HNH endonuclease [Halomonas salifodinae]
MQFDYDEDTGRIQYRKLSNKARRASSEAGHVADVGGALYRVVAVEYPSGKSRQVYAHRVIWKLMTAQEPPREIDHINGNTQDNRWANMRDGSGGANSKNRAMPKNNTSGACGVVWDKATGFWVARMGLGGVQRTLGYFENKEDAARAARSERLKNGFTERHGLPKSGLDKPQTLEDTLV